MWPRSPIRPSETSIADDATPRSATPSATRGSGSVEPPAERRAGTRVDVAAPACDGQRQRRVAQRARHVDRRRPACAPLRNSAEPAGTSPMSVTQRLRGPRVVSPPISSTSCASASAIETARECREPRRVGVGQRHREQRAARQRAHRGQVGQVDRKRLVAEPLWIGARDEMAAFDQHVDGQDVLACPATAR